MKSRLSILTVVTILICLATQIGNRVGAQGTTQPYLAEMPSVDRVIREIQGTNPADTAARRMGAFKQLKKIIEDLAWNLDHRYMTRLTPAEKQISVMYEEAYAQVWRAGPDKSADNMRGFDTDPRFRNEILNMLFSANFRALFAKSFADETGRRQAKAQMEVDETNRLKAQARAEHQGTTDPGRLQARRCVESGRDETRCLAEAVGGEIKTGIIDPILGRTNAKAGLRLNGIYPGRGFGIRFTHGLGEYSANVSCADLVPDPHPYEIELKNNQVVVRIANAGQPFSLVMQPTGRLVGPGSVVINGRVLAGYARQWVEKRLVSDNSVVPGSGHYESVPIYKPKTARCIVGTLTPTVDKNSANVEDAGIISFLTAITGTDTDVTPGLRLVGIFDGGPGVNLEFHPDSGTVGCREAAVAHKYTIGIRGSELVVNLEGPGGGAFTYLSDGTIHGPGSLTVSGRKAVGGSGPSDTNGIQYIPWTDTCTFNVLNPMRLGSRLDLSPLGLAPAPKQSDGPANAVLTISSGFPETGPEAALKGRTLMLLTDSFESILWDVGFSSSQIKAMPALATWAAACEANQQLCLQGAREGSRRKAAALVLDNNGEGSFAAVPAGIYYVFTQTIFNRHHFVWNYRIDLKPGQNILKLTETNATLK